MASAGAGAKLALLSAAEYRRAEQAARKVEFVELGSDPDFTLSLPNPCFFRPRRTAANHEMSIEK